MNSLIWGGEQKLVAGDAAELDQFGYSVSLTEDHAPRGGLRGATPITARPTSSSRAAAPGPRSRSSSPAMELEATTSAGPSALAGDRALVGAYGDDAYRGAAYVFVKKGTLWTEEQKLVASDGAEIDQLGYSVALAENHALVGAYGHDSARGAAYVFVEAAAPRGPKSKSSSASDGA